MSRRTRTLLLIFAGLIAVVAISVVYGRRVQDVKSVAMQRVTYERFKITLPESGVVQRPLIVTIPALVSGNLTALYVRPGDWVNAGELLATIGNAQVETNAAGSSASYQASLAGIAQAQDVQQNTAVGADAQVATALSNLSEARRTYAADQNLYENKAIPLDTLDQAKAKLDQAQVTYDQVIQQRRLGAINLGGQSSVAVAQAQARKAAADDALAQVQAASLRVVAPFDGQVQTIATEANNTQRTIQVGDSVTQGAMLLTIARGSAFIVRAAVDEQDIAQVRIGQPVVVSGEDFGTVTFPGHVASIDPTAQKSDDPSSTSRQVLTTIALDSNSPLLRDGMTADVDIATTNIPQALVVPNAAIVTEGNTKYVFIVREGIAKKTAVATGASSDTQTVITRGVASGDTVIVAPAGLVDGINVAPAPSSSPAPSST